MRRAQLLRLMVVLASIAAVVVQGDWIGPH
jgi:hypothetical protein